MLQIGSIFTTFEYKQNHPLKSSELHKLITRNKWELVRVVGSHYIYEKDGKTYPVPFHGAKEVGKGLEIKIKKEMKLK